MVLEVQCLLWREGVLKEKKRKNNSFSYFACSKAKGYFFFKRPKKRRKPGEGVEHKRGMGGVKQDLSEETRLSLLDVLHTQKILKKGGSY